MSCPISLKLTKDRACVVASDHQVLVIVGLQTRSSVRSGSLRGSEVALVMDCSGSMAEEINPGHDPALKLNKAIEGMWAAIDLLGREDTFTVIGFDQQAETVVDRVTGRDRHDLLQHRKSEIERHLRTQFGGRTNIYEALRLARSRLSSGRNDVIQRMVLLSDGAANEPGQDAVRLAVQMAEQCSKEGILIDVLGYGYGADMLPDLLSAIARPSGGKWVHVNQPPTEILREQLKNTRKVFASGVVLTLTFPREVQVRDVYRTEPVITYLGDAPVTATERTMHLRANQLELGKDYTWMIEVEAPAVVTGETPLLNAKLTYRLADGQAHTEREDLSVLPCLSEAEAAQRDRRYVLLIEQARLNKLERELSQAQARKDATQMIAILNQMIERCRDIGLTSQQVTYQRILDTFKQDRNFPRAALEAASTSTSVARKPSEVQRPARKRHRSRRKRS